MMSWSAIAHHPSSEWLLDYVAAKLDEGFRTVIAAHLESCPQCRQQVHSMQQCAASLVDELPLAEASEESLHKAWARIRSAPNTPAEKTIVLRDVVQAKAARAHWRTLGTVSKAKLGNGGAAPLSLLRIARGSQVPVHKHAGTEMTLILQGAYSDCFGRYGAGDLLINDENHQHAPMASADEECICLVAEQSATNLRFTGPLLRWVSPWLARM